MTTPRPILLLGFGNPARADDGLGPALARLLAHDPPPGLHAEWAYQPAVEHAAEIAARGAVIFADAAPGCREPFSLRRLLPRRADDFTSHDLRPEAVLALARDALGWRGPAYLLAIRASSITPFEECLSPAARRNLLAAAAALRRALAGASLDESTTDPPTDHSDCGGAPCQTANP